jgi:BASS family bile acid:Na+ symporter
MQSQLDKVTINFNADSLFLLNITLAVIMFGVALNIRLTDFKQLLKNPKPVFIGVLSQFVLLPAVTFGLVYLLKPSASIALGMFMVAACPGGNISNFMTHFAKGNVALSVCLTALATCFALFMTPLNFQYWAGLYPPSSLLLKTVSISPMDMFKVLFMLLGLPLILGMTTRKYFPKIAKKIAPYFKWGSIFFFLALIIIAFSNNTNVFVKYIKYVFLVVLLHNLSAFFTGYFIASISGLPKRDIRTIAIETGIQNSGLGLLLIFTFFNGLGGMAILVAFWGIWHIISGLLLAGYWSKKDKV